MVDAILHALVNECSLHPCLHLCTTSYNNYESPIIRVYSVSELIIIIILIRLYTPVSYICGLCFEGLLTLFHLHVTVKGTTPL